MRFNMKTGIASQKKLSEPAVDFPRVNESYTGRCVCYHVDEILRVFFGAASVALFIYWVILWIWLYALSLLFWEPISFPVLSSNWVLVCWFRKQRYVYGTILDSIAKVTGIIKFDLHAEPQTGKTKLEVGGNVLGIFDLGPGRFGSEAVFVPREPGTKSEEDDGYLIFFVHDETTGYFSLPLLYYFNCHKIINANFFAISKLSITHSISVQKISSECNWCKNNVSWSCCCYRLT